MTHCNIWSCFGFKNSPSYISVLPVSQVVALKEKIEEDRGKDEFPSAGQKLIYAGESENHFDRVTEKKKTH